MTSHISVPALLALAAAAAALPAGSQGTGSYEALVALHGEFETFRQPRVTDGVPDYTPAAMEAQKRGLEEFQRRLRAIDSSAWSTSQQVDHLVVRAQLSDLDFSHRVSRPWTRDPGLYVDLVRRVPYAELPASGESLDMLGEQLRAVPRILDQGRSNLSSASGELAGMAILQIERSDGINQGEPRRAVPPEGVIGWYNDLLERLPKHHPDLMPDARAALQAVDGFRDWLRERQPGMTEPAWIGLDNFNWYLRNVRLMPYTADDLRIIGEREFNRGLTFLKIEQHRSRHATPLNLAQSDDDHARRVRQAEEHIRAFTRMHELMTFPENLPPRFETDAFWIVRPEGPHFWEQLTYRDPRNNHIHASIPGHRMDGLIQRANPNPIRRSHRDGARAEGWAFYIEEMYLQAGLLDELPRSRELFYIAQFKRAVRIPSELKMQTGEFTLQQAIDFMVKEVPLMDENLARYDLEIYLRRPTYGMNYVMGKTQLEQLLADRARQLGDRFHLGRFHDEFLAAGPIPISLIRWELTGFDDEITTLRRTGS